MPYPYFAARTLDDLLRVVYGELLTNGKPLKATKGSTIELTGTLLELLDPRARLSRSETRGKLISGLGELCWFLAGNNSLSFIEYYIPTYKKSAEDGKIYGGYGPRFFSWRGLNQLENVIELLKKKPGTRQAVVQLFDAADLAAPHKDIPCTCTLQFMIRSEQLHMLTSMRSNDAYWGLSHDIFSFTMIQEIVARTLGVEVGTYKHAVGSLHVYEHHVPMTKDFMAEGFQSTLSAMPPMPVGDPWPSIKLLLDAEASIRNDAFDAAQLSNLDPYWADLARILMVYRHKKAKRYGEMTTLRSKMVSRAYDIFIRMMIPQGKA